MRDTLLLPFLLLSSFANAAKPIVSIFPFGEPLIDETYVIDNSTTPQLQLELVKRQNDGCASGYANCATLGAGGLCCPRTQVCARDSGGNVACCPPQASCTGTIRPNTNGGGGAFVASTTGTGTTSGNSLATTPASTTITGGGAATIGGGAATIGGATTTTEGGIVFVGAGETTAAAGGGQTSGASASRSYVNNPYFPYAYIPTTYTDAAACSSAYTTCHADFATCSAFLAGGPGAHGVTVSVAGGGGTTVVASAAPTTYPAEFASSVCASLSGSACYGLTVEACGRFGGATATGDANAAATRCPRVKYAAGVGAGMALGMMGLS